LRTGRSLHSFSVVVPEIPVEQETAEDYRKTIGPAGGLRITGGTSEDSVQP
jgi:hypothetical protein